MQIKESTTVDGPGLRTSIYCSGCRHACPGCHNPQTWDMNAGVPTDIDTVMRKIIDEDFCDVTFTGGDPMYQAEAFTELARRIKNETEKNIWCYTGFTYEECLADPKRRALVESVDVIVDGRFIADKRNTELLFRGSTNQRIIDVELSLKSGEVVLYDVEENIKTGI